MIGHNEKRYQIIIDYRDQIIYGAHNLIRIIVITCT